jgi:hypothetical protein
MPPGTNGRAALLPPRSALAKFGQFRMAMAEGRPSAFPLSRKPSDPTMGGFEFLADRWAMDEWINVIMPHGTVDVIQSNAVSGGGIYQRLCICFGIGIIVQVAQRWQ